jgi:hypothetical protein
MDKSEHRLRLDLRYASLKGGKSGLPAIVPDKPEDSELIERITSTDVVWGCEFGRTPMVQGGNDGRDHHPNCFTTWMAGGGLKKGITYGESDPFGFNGVREQVHVHNLNATILHLLGFGHTRLTYRFQGRDFRLTDVHGEIVRDVLALVEAPKCSNLRSDRLHHLVAPPTVDCKIALVRRVNYGAGDRRAQVNNAGISKLHLRVMLHQHSEWFRFCRKHGNNLQCAPPYHFHEKRAGARH